MVPSSNFNQSYYRVEYTFLPNWWKLRVGKGYELTKISRK